MDSRIIVRSVARPADGHYGTLKQARKAASSYVSICVLFDAERGYKLANEQLPGYDVITRKSAGKKWSRRNDKLPCRSWGRNG